MENNLDKDNSTTEKRSPYKVRILYTQPSLILYIFNPRSSNFLMLHGQVLNSFTSSFYQVDQVLHLNICFVCSLNQKSSEDLEPGCTPSPDNIRNWLLIPYPFCASRKTGGSHFKRQQKSVEFLTILAPGPYSFQELTLLPLQKSGDGC